VTPTTTGTRLLGAPVWMGSTFLSYDFGASRTVIGTLRYEW
jgi:hypothetical protein